MPSVTTQKLNAYSTEFQTHVLPYSARLLVGINLVSSRALLREICSCRVSKQVPSPLTGPGSEHTWDMTDAVQA